MRVLLFVAPALYLILFIALKLEAQQNVRLGIDRLVEQNFAPLRGKRVGLVTNPSGTNHQGISTLQILSREPRVRLVALFGPEHGVYGKVPAGKYVESHRDLGSGLWVHSLYGKTRKPTPEMMRGLDTIVFDLQDLGNRSYTYISTLGMVMEAALENDVEVIVLDRPNPLGGIRVEGPRLNEQWKSFVSQYNIPYVHGMTVGELAQWINDHYLPQPCRLIVMTMQGWTRDMIWEDTGLRWIATSPNIPTIGAARGYTLTGILGNIGITTVTGDRYPFEVITTSYLNPEIFTAQLMNKSFPGIRAQPYAFTATSGRFKGSRYFGARLFVNPRSEANFTAFAFHAMDTIRSLTGRDLFQRVSANNLTMFDKLNGSSSWRMKWARGASAFDLEKLWEPGITAWLRERQRYLLYR
jgi:uncharacterized protein YbbC (DUF1343 family)